MSDPVVEKVEPVTPSVAPPVEVAPKVEPKVEPKPAEGKSLLGEAAEKVSEGVTKEAPKEGAEKAEGKPAEVAKVVPDKYELKLPEGSALDPAQVEKVALFAKEKGLSQDEAQQVLEQRSDAVADYAKTQMSQFEVTKQGWREQAKSDKEIGGENLDKSMKAAAQVVQKYDPELFADMEKSGLGNHPKFLRFLVRVAKDMAPDTFISSNVGADDSKPASHRIWGYMNENKDKSDK